MIMLKPCTLALTIIYSAGLRGESMHLHQFHIQYDYQIMSKANPISLNSTAFVILINDLSFIVLHMCLY